MDPSRGPPPGPVLRPHFLSFFSSFQSGCSGRVLGGCLWGMREAPVGPITRALILSRSARGASDADLNGTELTELN